MLKTLLVATGALVAASCTHIPASKSVPAQPHSPASTMTASQATGVISVPSDYSVKQTADRFEALIKDKGLTLFSRIDHQKNAQDAGLSLPPTQVIVFGNPKAGTPLMQCAPSVAIDLPQKVLINQDAAQNVWLSYNDPNYLKARHHMTACDKVLANITTLLGQLSTAATTK